MAARRRRQIAGTAMVLVAAVLGAVLAAGSCRPSPPPSVILVSIDSLRPDHLGCYGYGRPTSPCLDALAREGVLFAHAVSSTSWTLPAHAALFTALPDSLHGCKHGMAWLDGSRQTVAEAFRAAGYETAGFFAGPYLHPYFGLAQGFDSYHDCTSYSAEAIAYLHGKADVDLPDLSTKDVTNPTVLREVGAWLEKHPAGPRFLFIHLWDVHFDYIPPPPYDRMFGPDYCGPVDGRRLARFIKARPAGWGPEDAARLQALYDGEIRWTDDTLAKLLGLFRRHGLGDAILAVTADHGEAFYEHGTFGHQQSLHDEEIRIPLIFHAPNRIQAGLRVERQARIIDIAPTLLDLAGLPPLERPFGRSLGALLEPGGPAAFRDEPAPAELFDDRLGLAAFAVRTPRWKEITLYPRELRRLFDLGQDPGELRPLAEPLPPEAAAMAGVHREILDRMRAMARELPPPGRRDTPALTRMTEKQLRALGYLK